MTAVAGSSDGATEATVATTAITGDTYGPLTAVAPITATDVEVNPAGNRLWISSRYGADGNAPDVAAFSSAPIPGFDPATGSALLETAAGGLSVGGQLVGIRPDGAPLTFLDGGGAAFPTTQYYYPFTGNPADNAQLNDPGQWGERVGFALPEPGKQNGAYEVASQRFGADPGELWIGYEALATDIQVRRWVGTGFGPAINPDCVSSRFAAGAQFAPALAISRTRALQIAYVGGTGSDTRLGYVLGTPDGGAFSAYQELEGGPSPKQDVELATDPSTDTGGVVVWTSDSTGRPGGAVSFTRLPAATPAACPPPPGTGTTGTTGPTGTVPITPPTTTKKPSLASVVTGLPSTKRCVSRRSFKVRLRNPKGTTIASATVRVNGKAVATRKAKRVTAPVNLKGLPKGRYTVKIRMVTVSGKVTSATRRYRTCAPKPRSR